MSAAGISDANIRIAEARWPDDHDIVAALLGEYVNSLGVDISFQDVQGELASLPGKYERPDGVAVIAGRPNERAGLIAYRPFKPGICEVKRLYVRPRLGFREVPAYYDNPLPGAWYMEWDL